jgi:uncharacterized coiled-coil protein SlyX
MPADTLLIILLTALGSAAVPLVAWWRAQRRIRELELLLLAQAPDLERYEELRQLVHRLSSETDQLADNQALLARRLSERADQLAAPRPERSRPVTPH